MLCRVINSRGIIVGDGFHAVPPQDEIRVLLNPIGEAVKKTIEHVNEYYDGVGIQKYVIMPNHIHMIVGLGIDKPGAAGGHGNPPLQAVVGQIKSYTTKRWNELQGTRFGELWQRSYHDHVIRGEEDFRAVWEYMDDNPRKWAEDKYYAE